MSGRRTCTVSASRRGAAEISIGPLLPKIAVVVNPVSSAKRPRAVPSAAACAAVAPGRSFATASNIDRRLPVAGCTRKGTQASVCWSGNARPPGRTPTIVCGSPSSCATCPRTPGSAPNRSLQSLSERMTTEPRFRDSSCSSNTFPMRGRAPSSGKRLAVTAATRMRSGSPAPESVIVRSDHAASASIVFALSRQAT